MDDAPLPQTPCSDRRIICTQSLSSLRISNFPRFVFSQSRIGGKREWNQGRLHTIHSEAWIRKRAWDWELVHEAPPQLICTRTGTRWKNMNGMDIVSALLAYSPRLWNACLTWRRWLKKQCQRFVFVDAKSTVTRLCFPRDVTLKPFEALPTCQVTTWCLPSEITKVAKMFTMSYVSVSHVSYPTIQHNDDFVCSTQRCVQQ